MHYYSKAQSRIPKYVIASLKWTPWCYYVKKLGYSMMQYLISPLDGTLDHQTLSTSSDSVL